MTEDHQRISAIENYIPCEERGYSYEALAPEIKIEIQELVLQSIANWPNRRTEMFIPSRTGISFTDVAEAQSKLRDEGWIISDKQTRYTIPCSSSRK